MAADACERYGLRLPALKSELSDIEPLVPEFASIANPVDFTSMIKDENSRAGGRRGRRARLGGLAARDQRRSDQLEFSKAFTRVWNATEMPVVGYLVGDRIEQAFADAGVRTCRALNGPSVLSPGSSSERGSWMRWRDTRAGQRATWTPSSLAAGTLDEFATKRLLAEFGIAVTPEELTRSPRGTNAAAAEIGYPVAVEALRSRDRAQERGRRRGSLGLRDGDGPARGVDRLARSAFPHVTAGEQMVHGDVELIVGGRGDPLVGSDRDARRRGRLRRAAR